MTPSHRLLIIGSIALITSALLLETSFLVAGDIERAIFCSLQVITGVLVLNASKK